MQDLSLRLRIIAAFALLPACSALAVGASCHACRVPQPSTAPRAVVVGQLSAADAARARPLPDSFEDAVAASVSACEEGLLDGSTQLVVEFDTAAGDETFPLLTRTMQVVQPWLPQFLATGLAAAGAGADGELGPTVQLLFPDEGNAAYAAQKWELPDGVRCGSMPRAKLADGCGALLLVAPGATEVAAVQRLVREASETAPTMPLIMFNPKLVDMQSTGYGLVGRELRNQVEKTFLTAFALKTLVDGAVFRQYPGEFTVWSESEGAAGGYALAYIGAKRPSPDDVDEILDGGSVGDGEGDGEGFMREFSKFVKGFQAM